MSRSLVYLLYNLLLPLALVVGLPGYISKGLKRGNLGRNFRQRFGRLPRAIAELDSRPLWIHAVSVGEVLVASKMIRAIRLIDREQPIVLSTTTTTGYRVAEKELGTSRKIFVIHNPVDLSPVVRKVVRHINPRALVLVEAEIWPNLVLHARSKNIPVLLANARLSPRSERRYLRFRNLIEPVFSQIDAASVPFPSDVDRWTALGIRRESIRVVGSVKFDESVAERPGARITELADWLESTGCDRGRRIFLGGSTHPGEERICADTWSTLTRDHPDLALVLVPRHAERAPEIDADLRRAGFDPILRSRTRQRNGSDRATQKEASTPDRGRNNPDRSASSKRIWISDTTGELRAWFHLASVVFMGKSLGAKGGQNPVEPILAGKPVIVGPEMQNFREVVADLVSREGITQIDDAAGLVEAVAHFIVTPETGKEQAARGIAALLAHHGAATRTAEWILDTSVHFRSSPSNSAPA